MPVTSESLQLGPWYGGVRYDKPAEECLPNELSDMENTRVDQAGQVETRGGSLSYQSLDALATGPALTMCAQFDKDADTSFVVIAAATKLYKFLTDAWVDITGSETITAGADNTFEWANANGTLVLTNGVDTDAIKWTGTGDATTLDDDARFSKAQHIAWWDNRLWFGNVNGATDQLWFSDTADIETYGATSFFNFGGVILGLVPSQNALIVHTSIGLFTLIPTGSATLPYRPNERTQKAGLDGRSSVSLPDDKQVMLLKDGVYEWSGGAELEKISGQLDGARYWDDIQTERLRYAWALEYPSRGEVWFGLPHGIGTTQMNHVMCYNRIRRQWHGPYTGWTRNCAALIAERPHLGGHDGILYDSDTGENDGTSAIDCRFESGGPAPIAADYKVRWLSSRLFFDGEGDYPCTVTQRGSEVFGEPQTLSLRGGSFLLDSSYLDGTDILQEIRQIAGDVPMVGYSPQASIRVTMYAADQKFAFYKMLLRFKGLGRFLKPPVVDI